jgi:hypothetical protein
MAASSWQGPRPRSASSGMPMACLASSRRTMKTSPLASGLCMPRSVCSQMELQRRYGAGRLSQIFGPQAVATDRQMLVLGLYRAAEAEIPFLNGVTTPAERLMMGRRRGAFTLGAASSRSPPCRSRGSRIWSRPVAPATRATSFRRRSAEPARWDRARPDDRNLGTIQSAGRRQRPSCLTSPAGRARISTLPARATLFGRCSARRLDCGRDVHYWAPPAVG